MKVKKFSFFSSTDKYDMKFQHEICWSRVYEYPFVLNEIKRCGIENPYIHNASWGNRDIHLIFKTWLDVHYYVRHSDVIPSTLYNTYIWDITKRSPFKENFDIVINVSTIEEISENHVDIIKNHLDQVNEGGMFIMTFDYPGIQLEEVERFLMRNIDIPQKKLTPRNSVLPDRVLGLPDDFSVGYLVIEK